MRESFNHRECINPSKIWQQPEVVEIFERYHWIDYFNKLRGYNYDVAREFSMNFQKHGKNRYAIVVKGLEIFVTKAILIKISRMRCIGVELEMTL